MSASESVKPPFGPPDCNWDKVNSSSSIPETAVYKDGKLKGNKIYIGRVYDGNCILIGTVNPEKGVCMYLNKSCEVKSSSEYEILTVECGDPLEFEDMDLDNRNIFVAGIDEKEEILYVGRYIDEAGNTYYGWIDKSTRSLYIPRDLNSGPQILQKDFGVLIHKYLDRLCICPPCPPQCI